jgi:hypothetical protein
MSEPDKSPNSPRWLNEISDELREGVPVRAAWRSRLLDEVAHARRPSAGDTYDDSVDDTSVGMPDAVRHRRGIVLRPLTAIAAAVLFAVLGAGVTYATLSARGGTAVVRSDAPRDAGRGTALVSDARTVDGDDREIVRFTLAAPNAAHVALVGSFNEWNPVATPLIRDRATGTWIVSLRLRPGRHVYAFVVDGDVKADPAAPRAADDDFGSSNSVVLVSGSAS